MSGYLNVANEIHIECVVITKFIFIHIAEFGIVQ